MTMAIQQTEFPWLGSTEGLSDQVLPPWTPLIVAPSGPDAPCSIACWGRRYDFAEGPFPTAIESAGQSLLAGPIQVMASVLNQPVTWHGQAPTLLEETPARVVLQNSLSSEELLLTAQTTLEYDGLIRVDWQLQPHRPLTLEKLTLEIPLCSQYARYLYHYPGQWGESYNARALPESGFVTGFRPFIWLGDEERGLAWFCESDQNWFPAAEDQAIEIVREGDRVVLRIELVGKPLALPSPGKRMENGKSRMENGKLGMEATSSEPPFSILHSPLSYIFGFQATPVRPNPEDVWDWRLCHGGDYGIETLHPEAPTTLRYPAEGNILLQQGTVEVWVQPLFDLDHQDRDHDLFSLQLPRGDEIRWFWPREGGMCLLVRQQQDRIVELEMDPQWQPGRFHHLALTWGEALRVYQDGQLLGEAPRAGTIVGCTAGGVLIFGSPGNHLLLDDVRISDRPRSPEELQQAARSDGPLTLDDSVLLLDHLDLALEPGSIEHLDAGYGGYCSTQPVRAAGDWGWQKKPGGIIGLGRFRAGRFGRALELGLDKPPLDYLAEQGVRTLCIHEQWTDLEGYFSTTHGEKLRSLVQACHARGIRLLVYLGFLLSDLAPEWPAFGEDCIVEPRHVYDPYDFPPQPHQKAYTVCYRSVWQEALAWGIARLMDEYDVDGVYLDGTANPWPCSNERHGCGYVRPDGSRGVNYPIFSTREMMRRIYTIVKTRKPDGQVNVHQSTCMTIPTLSWATSYWDGEQFGSIEPGPFALETIPLDAFRTEFMGHQWGVPAEFLCYDRPYTYEQACAFTLLHDVPVRPNGLGPHLELASKLWRIQEEFGRREAEWLPYWRNGDYITVTPEGVRASLYRNPTNGVLLVISNLSLETAQISVRLDQERLGLPSDCRAWDALTGEILTLQAGCFTASLASLEWRLVWIRGK